MRAFWRTVLVEIYVIKCGTPSIQWEHILPQILDFTHLKLLMKYVSPGLYYIQVLISNSNKFALNFSIIADLEWYAASTQNVVGYVKV